MAAWELPAELSSWIVQMSCVLDRRIQERLLSLMVGALFGQGRRTVASWLRGGELGDDFRRYYYFLGSLGRNIKSVAGVLLRRALCVIVPGDRLVFAIDDTATKRQGPLVEGAGIHHNPTPGAAENKFLYGHVWVVLSWVVRHPWWGTIGLPILARMYVRQKNLQSIAPWYNVKFQTKLEQAVELVVWLVQTLACLEKAVWIVVDGGYVKRPFLQPVLALGVIIVGRLRKDAALYTVPEVVDPKKRKRGQPRKYGKDRISLAKRAGHRAGWQTGEFVLYNKKVKKTYKTFLATYEPVGGKLRVVLVKEKHGWFAYFCTKADASVQEILEAVADRAAIEQNFHDLKEVHGAGQQQLRNYWANIAAFHVTMWWYTLIELWAWHKPQEELTDRSASPWDKEPRRPSHADRRNALRRQCLAIEFSRAQLIGPIARKIQSLWNRVTNLVA
jgi:DDE superfamily endonuclease